MNEYNRALYIISILFFIGLFLIQKKDSNSFSEITENEIMEHIRFLSHENKEGRYPGTRGSKDVISYIIKEFKSYGLKPGLENTYVQPFDITTGIKLVENNWAILNGDTLIPNIDYTPLSFSSNANKSGSIVFAGYGFNINEINLQWNDYLDIDVTNKWVMVMRHSPERSNQHSSYSPYVSLHKKMLVARDKGALGVVFISQIEDENLIPLEYKQGYNNIGIPSLHLSNKKAEKLLKTVGWTRKTLQQTMNRSLESVSFELKGSVFSTTINLKQIQTRAANVIGKIRSGNRKYRDEYIVIGAHFDHLGTGGPGSGSRQPSLISTHPGANDNASGTAGLLELAQKLSSQKNRLKRSILFIGFDAEEKGLLGSKYFIENSPIETENIITMINMDMIGGVKDSSATISGVGTSPSFQPLIDSLSLSRTLDFSLSMPGFGPSDHASFYSKDVPVLFFFSGFHEDYHTPKDTWKNINLKGEKDILDLIYDITYHLSRSPVRPTFSEAGPKKQSTNIGSRFKVTLGIMPLYGSLKPGLEIDTISKSDGPAARAGMKKGDIIKSINGKPIKDIYEYMDRLGELEKGSDIPVEIERGGKNITLRVVF